MKTSNKPINNSAIGLDVGTSRVAVASGPAKITSLKAS